MYAENAIFLGVDSIVDWQDELDLQSSVVQSVRAGSKSAMGEYRQPVESGWQSCMRDDTFSSGDMI